MAEALLKVENLQKQFLLSRGFLGLNKVCSVDAVSGISFDVDRGETLALVGESGCGKSTVGRCLLRLVRPSGGTVHMAGRRIDDLPESRLRVLRKQIQVVFQDPFSSLNPRMRIREVLAEPLRNFGLARGVGGVDLRIAELLRQVGLPEDASERWPHEFSGGQRQRIGIARALAAEPEIIICDEAVSALDVSVKAQIVNLLRDLQHRTGIAMLFISHDLAIVENIANRVGVMYLGKLVEIAPRRSVYAQPRHPYTRALMSAVPIPDPAVRRERVLLRGDIPSPINPPTGCRFHTRCPLAFDRCGREEPRLAMVGDAHLAACHLNDRPEADNPLLNSDPRLGAPATGATRP